MDQRADDQDIRDIVQEMTDFVEADPATSLSIPASVADGEAVHAVQAQYAEAGFECDETMAQAIVDDAR